MKRYRFSSTERYAIYTIHGPNCYLCSTPIDLRSMSVDHVLPASLPSNPKLYAECLCEYGLPPTFDVDSFENWLPSCAKCNSEKGAHPFRPTPIIQRYLQRAIDSATEVRGLVETTISNQKMQNALAMVTMGLGSGKIDDATIAALIPDYRQWHTKTDSGDNAQGELRLTPDFTVLYDAATYRIVRVSAGLVGYVPTTKVPHSSFYCGNCGSLGPWNGSICLGCNMIVSDD
jgi:5-methylcytosine-specific restriction endonuclease McrA